MNDSRKPVKQFKGGSKKREEKPIDINRREFFKLQESESIYGIPPETIRKWIKRDSSDGLPPLEAFKPGKDYIINKKTFETYLKRFPAA